MIFVTRTPAKQVERTTPYLGGHGDLHTTVPHRTRNPAERPDVIVAHGLIDCQHQTKVRVRAQFDWLRVRIQTTFEQCQLPGRLKQTVQTIQHRRAVGISDMGGSEQVGCTGISQGMAIKCDQRLVGQPKETAP